MAQLMRMGWFRAVHVKAPMVQESLRKDGVNA
jgi:hypothetical protein